MNEQDRRELEELSAAQRELRRQLERLERRIEDLKWRAESPVSAPSAPPPPPPQPAFVPPPLPPAAGPPSPPPEPLTSEPSAIPPPPPPLKPPPTAEPENFEMRFGTYWLVRIGIVLMLTSAVFFGREYFTELGAAGKVAVLYLAGAAALGLGLWLERGRESLRNFARVLMAGGFAAIYYTTYAAGHVEGLRIIGSEWLAGALLLGWAGVMVAVADRKKSQTLALLGVLLAYYSSSITDAGYFTLFSNLVLTAAAVFLLVRHRWAGLTVASLLAAYASYAFWRFYHGGEWILQVSPPEFWMSAGFLAGYWTLFTSAVFLARDENFSGAAKGMFLTLNNGALFTLILMSFPQAYWDSFWLFCACFGGVLLTLALAARLWLRDDPVRNSYAAQGLLLLTLGIMSYFTGKTLALVLTAETVALMLAGYQLNSRILRGGAYALSPVALCFGLAEMKPHESEGLWMAIAMGAAMVFTGWWVKRKTLKAGAIEFQPKPAYFAFLGVFLWVLATTQHAPDPWHGPLLALEAALLTFSVYILRCPELSILGQFLLLIAQLIVVSKLDSKELPWWNPLVTLAVTLALSHWWQRQRILLPGKRGDHFFPALYAVAAIAILYLWTAPHFEPAEWTVAAALLSVALLAYGAVTRLWYLAALGQFFLLASAIRFCGLLLDGHPAWYAMLLPILVVVATGLVARAVIRDPGRAPQEWDPTVLALSRLYAWIAFLMGVFYVFEYVPHREQFWTFSLAAFVLHLWGARTQNGARLGIAAAFSAIALLIFLFYTRAQTIYFPNLLAAALLLAQQQITRRVLPTPLLPSGAHAAMIVGGLVAVWVYVSSWVLTQYSGFALTGSWALVALGAFLAGFVLRERAYRLTSLTILGLAIVKVFGSDIWTLDPFYRWLTAFVLGAVCIAVSFIYARYANKIKNWL